MLQASPFLQGNNRQCRSSHGQKSTTNSCCAALHRPCWMVGAACCRPAHSCKASTGNAGAAMDRSQHLIAVALHCTGPAGWQVLHAAGQPIPARQAFAGMTVADTYACCKNNCSAAVQCTVPVCMLQPRTMLRGQCDMYLQNISQMHTHAGALCRCVRHMLRRSCRCRRNCHTQTDVWCCRALLSNQASITCTVCSGDAVPLWFACADVPESLAPTESCLILPESAGHPLSGCTETAHARNAPCE
jgi:hypothetical protein